MSRLSFVKFVSKLGHVALADLRRWKEGRGWGEREEGVGERGGGEIEVKLIVFL